MRIKLFAGMLVLGTIATGACLDDSITGNRPLTLHVQVVPDSVGVGETVSTQYSATGTGLIGVIIDWGDGQVDSVDLRGTAVTAAGTVEHEYESAGDFQVEGTAEAQNGVITSTATVRVN